MKAGTSQSAGLLTPMVMAAGMLRSDLRRLRKALMATMSRSARSTPAAKEAATSRWGGMPAPGVKRASTSRRAFMPPPPATAAATSPWAPNPRQRAVAARMSQSASKPMRKAKIQQHGRWARVGCNRSQCERLRSHHERGPCQFGSLRSQRQNGT